MLNLVFGLLAVDSFGDFRDHFSFQFPFVFLAQLGRKQLLVRKLPDFGVHVLPPEVGVLQQQVLVLVDRVRERPTEDQLDEGLFGSVL